MGDAAFIVLIIDPISFLLISVITSIVGIVVGYALDLSGVGEKLQGQSDKDIIKKSKKAEFQSNITKKEKKILPD
jgi:hypothetical protein